MSLMEGFTQPKALYKQFQCPSCLFIQLISLYKINTTKASNVVCFYIIYLHPTCLLSFIYPFINSCHYISKNGRGYIIPWEFQQISDFNGFMNLNNRKCTQNMRFYVFFFLYYAQLFDIFYDKTYFLMENKTCWSWNLFSMMDKN